MTLRHLPRRRTGALAVAAVAAAATTAALLPPLTASAAPVTVAAVTEDGYDTRPLETAAQWLRVQLAEGDGVLTDPTYGPNTSATVDAGRSFWFAGDDETVAEIVESVAPLADSYTGDNGFGTLVSAGGSAKLATLVQYAAGDPTSYGGVDLISRLEGQVTTEGDAIGRIFDTFDPENEFAGDYANGFGQAFAVEALHAANSDLTNVATEFLLDQQCADGGFRLYFSDPAAADQTCDGAAGEGSTDVTALAILALLDQATDEDNVTAILDAVDFLVTTQGEDGSWGDGGQLGPNANSTGLAALALGIVGAQDGNPADIDGEPEAGAAWLRAHQVNEVATCTTALAGEQGALAYDDAALTAGRVDGITEDATYQWQFANAQALPALQWSLAAEGGVGMRADSGRQRSGGTMSVLVAGLAPGETGCLVGGQQPVSVTGDLDGQTVATVRVPVGTNLRNLYLGTSTRSSIKISYWSLAATRFGLTSTPSVRQNGLVAVRVSGLAPGEPFTLSYHGRVRGTGKADANGRASFAFRGGNSLGRWEFAIVGQYSDRFVTSTFTVTR
ncbi:MAG TPA: prenyltransferase/squalene oxidase repeat-containing protein [Nocardioides sp.]